MKKEESKIPKSIPPSSGIYKMIDEEGRIIYVGKAKNLKKRIKQYFQKNYEHSTRTKKLLEKTCKIDFTVVDSELEAILLETNLIKQLQPKYNILMKDDKNYVYIKITDEDFPKIQTVRKIEKDSSKYFGPKTASHKVKETLKILKKIFPFRHCNLGIDSIKGNIEITKKTIKYPCLDFYIKRCAAPCIGKCTKEEYKKIIKNIENFLNGKVDDVLKNLTTEMETVAKNREFEKAAKLRDKIQKVKDILEKQKISSPDQTNTDIINYIIEEQNAYFNLFQIREGKLINQENFILTAKEIEEKSENSEVLEAFINQYYEITTDIPEKILIPHEASNIKDIKSSNNKKTKIEIPKIGTKNKLLEMSLLNAKIFADRNKPKWYKESESNKKATEELAKLLKIKTNLKRIEAYDISHLSGTETVGSMIVFKNGAPENKMYRKFKLKTIKNKPDDYKSIEEVLARRIQKIALEYKFKNYKFKKDKKSEIYLLKEDKKTIGSIKITEHSNKTSQLKELWVEEKERGKKLGYKILKEAIKKTKGKRIYIFCKKELKEYYQIFGFEEIKKVPKEINIKNKLCLVYDKIKHKEDKSFLEIPDLIIIDGGKGQLKSGIKVLEKFEIRIPVISIAKQFEEIYLPKEKSPITLDKQNEILKLIQRMRDEAHRFAITYNKKLREKKFSKK
jgi:excinuclease ABC subunit C